MPFSELPRPLLVRSILRELGRSSDILQRGQTGLELTASRVADAVEAAVDIFAGFDDPQPMHSAILDRTLEGLEEIRAAAGAPSSPEDLDHPAKMLAEPRDPVRFPQPFPNNPEADKPAPSLILLPGTKEAERVMKDREIAPIRPRRAAVNSETTEGETPQWEYQELVQAAMLRLPDKILVTPEGVQQEIQLDRVFTTDAASGIVKAEYTVVSQRDSTPTVYGSSADTPMNIPVSVGTTLSVYDTRTLNFADIIGELTDKAKSAMRPRSKGLVSSTTITNQSLEGLFSEIMRDSTQRSRSAHVPGATGNSDAV